MATFSNTFSYSPLILKEDIRLLVLCQGVGSDPLICRLVHAEFARRPFYQALSYTWGTSPETKPLTLDGQSIQIRTNLWWALWNLRLGGKSRLLWVDSLCIDQFNVMERNHQVGLMSQIYSHASEVLVWLGLESEDSDCAMTVLRYIYLRATPWQDLDANQHTFVRHMNLTRKSILGRLDAAERTALYKLCTREYWRRMWILQEVSLARRLTIHCGSKSVGWDAFTKLHSLDDFTDDYPEFKSSFAYRLQMYRENRQMESETTLKDLLMTFEGSQCRDPRDQVFALLGMASDCQKKNFKPIIQKLLSRCTKTS
jgi:hypothetical protein